MNTPKFQALAFAVSGLLTLLLMVVAGMYSSLPQGQSALFGLGLFVATMIYDLCVLFYVWSKPSAKEGGVAARWKAGLAAGSLLLALTAGVLLRSLSPLLWEAFLLSFSIVMSAFILVSHWLETKSPESEARTSKEQSRSIYIFNGLAVLLLSFSLGLETLPESSRAALASMVLAVSAAAPLMIYGRVLQQEAH